MSIQSNNKSNRGTKIMMTIFGVFLLFIASIPFISYGSYMFGGKPKELNDILFDNQSDISNYNNKFVSADIDRILDIYAETSHSYGFIPVGKENHYILWVGNGSLMSLAISGKKEEIESIINATWDYLNEESEYLTDKPLHVEGVITSLSGDVRKYYDEVLDYYEIDSSVVDVQYYEIDTTESRLVSWFASLLMVVLGLICLYAAFAKPKKNNLNKVESTQNTVINNSINGVQNTENTEVNNSIDEVQNIENTVVNNPINEVENIESTEVNNSINEVENIEIKDPIDETDNNLNQ